MLIITHLDKSSTDIYSEILEQYTHLPYIEGTAPHLRLPALYSQVNNFKFF